MKAKYQIPMKFQDGDGGRRMKREFTGWTTIDLILEGHRTATSRDMSKKYNNYTLKVGDIVEFYSGYRKVYVEITKEPYSITEISREEWSKLECWDPSVYDGLTKKYQQTNVTLRFI